MGENVALCGTIETTSELLQLINSNLSLNPRNKNAIIETLGEIIGHKYSVQKM